jgi:hypothetical protein
VELRFSDEQWFEHNLNPQASPIRIPDLPPPKIQVRFTGASGRENLTQAFEFYKFVLDRLPPERGAQYHILDFGGGWGRILRFFLRDIPAERLVLADCLTDAIDCANSLHPPYNVVKSGVAPPLPFNRASVGSCYAYSVFSHLSEKAARNWITHLGEVLVDGGKLFITTRGPSHIEVVRSAQSGSKSLFKGILRKILRRKDPFTDFRTLLPHPDKIKERLEQGMFQFYPTGGGGELSDDFYGEAWITENWMQENHASLGFRGYEFFPESGAINQCIFVLTK